MKIFYGAVAVVVLAGLAILIPMDTRTSTKVPDEIPAKNADFIVFSKSMGWGPCPPGEKCETSAQVWKSGKFLKEYEFVRTLSKTEMDQIEAVIKQNNLLTLKCEPEQIDDLTFTYIVSDGKTENIFNTPLCKDLFKPIEKILGI